MAENVIIPNDLNDNDYDFEPSEEVERLQSLLEDRRRQIEENRTLVFFCT